MVVTGTGTHRRINRQPRSRIRNHSQRNRQRQRIYAGRSAGEADAQYLFLHQRHGHYHEPERHQRGTYILILENGRRLAGEDRYTRINVANIKRIEILNGAASALYGSDAIGGVINIITDDARNTVNVSSYTHYSGEGRLTESVNADVNAGKFSSYNTPTSAVRQEAGRTTTLTRTATKRDALLP